MSISFDMPLLLWLLPLALLPWLKHQRTSFAYSWLGLLPVDQFSERLSWAEKIVNSLIVSSLIIAIAGPYSGQQEIAKVGTGAQIVVSFDRSASMRSDFADSYMGGDKQQSKSMVAKQLLKEFIDSRPHDLIGMVSFSSAPVYVMPLTQSRAAIDAAIMGTQTGSKGTTNIAPALAMALGYFDNQALTSSRIILLISDGAAKMEAETQVALRQLFQQNQARLYWIYLRNRNGVKLNDTPKNANESTTPELFLHQFFQTLEVPYRAFEAENPQMLRESIAEIDRLENKPILYYEKTPRRDLASWCYSLAIVLLVLLIPLRWMEIRASSMFTQGHGA